MSWTKASEVVAKKISQGKSQEEIIEQLLVADSFNKHAYGCLQRENDKLTDDIFNLKLKLGLYETVTVGMIITDSHGTSFTWCDGKRYIHVGRTWEEDKVIRQQSYLDCLKKVYADLTIVIDVSQDSPKREYTGTIRGKIDGQCVVIVDDSSYLYTGDKMVLRKV